MHYTKHIYIYIYIYIYICIRYNKYSIYSFIRIPFYYFSDNIMKHYLCHIDESKFSLDTDLCI